MQVVNVEYVERSLSVNDTIMRGTYSCTRLCCKILFLAYWRVVFKTKTLFFGINPIINRASLFSK